jgi:hypothetical protein
MRRTKIEIFFRTPQDSQTTILETSFHNSTILQIAPTAKKVFHLPNRNLWNGCSGRMPEKGPKDKAAG